MNTTRSLRCSINKESGTNGKMYMTLTVVWHDVVLITNPVNMVYSDHSVLYYTFRLSKNVFPLDEFVIPFPPYHISAKLYSPFIKSAFFCSPSKFTPTPTHTEKMIGPLSHAMLVLAELIVCSTRGFACILAE